MYYILNRKGEVVEQYTQYREALRFFNRCCGTRAGLRLEAYAEYVDHDGDCLYKATGNTMAEAMTKLKAFK